MSFSTELRTKGAAGSAVSGIFGGFLGIAAAVALALLLFPSTQYAAVSNYLQIVVAFSGAVVLCYFYLREKGGNGLLWAAGAFAIWGISNAGWYAAAIFWAGTFTFPSPMDLGFAIALIVLSSAYKRIYPRRQAKGFLPLVLLVVMMVVPLAILAIAGVTDQTLMILLFFFACGLLAITALNHTVAGHPAVLAGTILFVLAYMAYPIRETFFPANTLLSVLGPCVAAGFSLIVIGLVPSGSTAQPSPEEPPENAG